MNEHDQAKPTSERHVPVLKDRCINLLAPGFEAARQRGETPVAIDATLGMGGHSEAMLQRFPDLHLIGIDRDEEALALAGERLKPFAPTLSTLSTTKSPTSWRTSAFRRSTAS
jgi:16S rRNA (cytosine1402-N4)-methyltransferase